MNLRLALAAIVLLCGPTSALAHRVDEYLQAAMFNVERDHVNLDLHLTPGIEVFAKVLAAVDLDGDGEISPASNGTYAEEVRRDLSLSIDGSPAPLKLRSVTFPALAEMKQGLGEIVLDFESADDPGRPARRLVFENHHLAAISVYLVNCLLPATPISA